MWAIHNSVFTVLEEETEENGAPDAPNPDLGGPDLSGPDPGSPGEGTPQSNETPEEGSDGE